MTDAYLKSWLDRVENLENEQKGIGADKRDLYTEAKSKGYNPKALRRIVAARKRKDEDEIEADVETYKVALGLAVDLVRNDKLSLREASRKTGASKSSIHRALAVPAASQTPDEGAKAAPVQTNNDAPALPVAQSPTGHSDASPRRAFPARASTQPAPEGGEGTGILSTEASGPPGIGSGTAEVTTASPAVDADSLDIPPFLRRSAA